VTTDDARIAAYQDWLNSRSDDEADLLAEAYERGLESISELRRIEAEDREADYGTSFWKEDR